MIATWWDNLKESCDMRMMAGTAAAVCWLLLLAVSPVFSSAPTLIAQGLSWRIAAVAFSAALFTATLIASTRHSAFGSKGSSAVPPATGAASFLGVMLHRFAEGDIIDVFAAALVALGVVGLCLGWASPFSAIRLRKRVVASAAGAISGCILYLAIVAMPQPFALLVGSCLPIASATCWLALGESARKASDKEDAFPACSATPHTPTSAPDKHAILHPFGRKLSAAIALYGMLFVLAGHVLPETESAWVSSIVPGIINVAAFLLVEIILTAYMVKRIHRENPVVAYRPATILVATAFLLLPFSTAELSIVCMAIAFAGFGSFMVFFWIVMGNVAQKYRLPYPRVFSQGFLMLLAGIGAGEIASWLLVAIRQPGFDYVATLSIVSLFLLVTMVWQMSDGAQFANETKEMGGEFFERDCPEDNASESPNLKSVAEAYRLSPRETEVLALLVKGRSIPYICDELFIAKSTAQTHVRHIYAKMEITEGRQELIDRIEAGSPEAPA